MTGTNRFIPVKSDDTRILTCILEYPNDTYVTVTDLLYEKVDIQSHQWKQSVSSYSKIRISESSVKNILASCGFVVVDCVMRCRMLYVICKK